MIVAITGATGFIGRRLIMRHLNQGDKVRVLSRRSTSEAGLPNSVQWFQGDLSNTDNLQTFVDGADVLYHCAGEIRDPLLMESVHVVGTHRLIEAATDRIGCWVQLSSTGAYGQQREGIITELTQLNPRGIYEVTKVQSDALVKEASSSGAFQHVILRPSIVYGAAMPNQSLYNMISMIERGWFFFIGKSGASANYIHVDNVVEALVLCSKAHQAIGQVYNLSDHCTLEYFVANIAKLLGCSAPRTRLPELSVRMLTKLFGRIPGVPLTGTRVDALTNSAVYSNEKIEQELGYRHLLSMEDGLNDLVSYWQSGYNK